MKLRKMLSVLTAAALVFSNLTIPVSAQEMETVVLSEGTVESESESMSKLEEDHYSEESAEIGANDETENSRSEEQSESNSDNESEVITEIKSSSQETGSESVTEIKSELQESETDRGSMTENEETVTQTESESQEESESQSEENTEIPTNTEITEEVIQVENEGETLTEGDFQYEVGSNGEVAITKYTGNETSIVVPEEIDGKKVTSIGREAFEGCKNLISITLPKELTSIRWYAFSECRNLTSIILPDRLTSIENGAFNGCSSLISITLPKEITRIGEYTFSGCSSLTSITLSEKLLHIGRGAFCDCRKLTSITLPEGLISIGESAFSGCSSLTSIVLPEEITRIEKYTFSGCSSLTGITLPEGLSIIEFGAFNDCRSLTGITLPEEITRIEEYAFSGCSSLTSITLPERLSIIESGVFSGCSTLTDITLPEEVTNIEGFAFNGCSSLTSIILPEGITSIEDSAFRGCSSLTNIALPEGLISIGACAFRGCSSLTSIILPEEITCIEKSTFSDCRKLTSIILPERLSIIEFGAFNGCSSLTEINLPESLTNIGDWTFSGCSKLTNITLFKGLTSVGLYAFSSYAKRIDVYYEGTREEWEQIKQADPFDDEYERSGLKYRFGYYDSDNDTVITYEDDYYVYIHCNSVISDDNRQDSFINVADDKLNYTKTYGDAAFQLEGISKIGDGTLVYTVTSGNDVVEVSLTGMVTIKNAGTAVITVSMAATDTYKEAESRTISITVNEQGTQSQSDYRYKLESNGEITITGYTGKESNIIVPSEIDGKKVTRIGDYAFNRDDNDDYTGVSLRSVVLPEGIYSIGEAAFSNCIFLESITLPKGLISMGDFENCIRLQYITIPDSVTSMGSFASCRKLKSITFPRGITCIEGSIFEGCINLESIKIPKSVKEIQDDAFYFDEEAKVDRFDIYYEGTEEEWKKIQKGDYWFYDDEELIDLRMHYNCGWENEGLLDSYITITSDKQSYIKNLGDTAFQLEGITKTGNGTLVYTVTSGKDIVEVSSSGMVSIKNEGTAVITVSMAATDTYKEAESRTISITVNKKAVQIEADYTHKVESNGEVTITGYTGRETDIIVPSEIAGKKVTGIAEYAFNDGGADGAPVRTVILPDGIKTIGNAAFAECKKLQTITLPDSIISIGESAFDYCIRLQSIVIPKGVTCIQDGTFADCRKMQSIIIPKSVKEIGEAFEPGEDSTFDTFHIYYEGTEDEWSQIKKTEEWFRMVDDEYPVDLIYHYNYGSSGDDTRLDAVITIASDKQSYTKTCGDTAFQLEGITKTGDGSLVYSVTSGNDVVEVSQTGMVTIKNAGTAVITVSMAATDTYKEAESKTITIIVSEEKEENPGTEESSSTEESSGNEESSSTEESSGNEESSSTEESSGTEEISNIFSVSKIAPQSYTGTAIKPDVIVTHNGRRLVLNQDYTLAYKNNTKAGTASVTVKGKGNYAESQTVTFAIEKKDLNSSGIIIDDLALSYNGKVQKKAPAVTYRGKQLKAGTDYNVAYESGNFKDKGTYTVSITGRGNFKGEASGKVFILDKSMIISNAKVILNQKKYDYTGNEIKPSVTVNLKGTALTPDKDYTISYVDNIQPGKAAIVIKGTGNYAGTKKVPFTIKKQPVNLTENMISLPASVAYVKGGCMPEPTITADGKTLTKGADYTVSYKNNKKTGTASLVVKGKGSYKGTVTRRFTITPKEISKTSMRVPDVVYTAKAKAGKYISRPILTDTDGNVLGSADYMNVVYECGNQRLDRQSRPAAGSVIKVTVTGKGNYTGTASAEYTLKDARAFAKAKVSVSPKSYTGGKVTLQPADLRVSMNGGNLVYGKDYEIVASSYKNNKKKGTAQVTLRGKGDYAGEKTVKFKITARKINVK